MAIVKMSRAAGVLKRVLAVLSTMAKNNTLALKSKARALKARFVIFFLLRNRKIMMMDSLSHKMGALIHRTEKDEARYDKLGKNILDVASNRNACVLASPEVLFNDRWMYDDCEDKECENLEELDAVEEPGGSVIELVKHSKEEQGEEFKLEDEVDILADLFIKRFRSQMRMQKQLSSRKSDSDQEELES